MAFSNTIVGKFLIKCKNILLLILIIGLVLLLLVKSCECNRLKNNIHNITDTLSTYILKNGQIASLTQSYHASISEMEDSLELLSGTLKDLEKELNTKITNIVKIDSNIKCDTIYISKADTIFYSNTDTLWTWTHENNWIYINGFSSFPSMETQINSLTVNTPLVIGWTNDNIVWCTSSNPYISITKITAIQKEESSIKKFFSHFDYGIQLGIGPTYTFNQGWGFGLYAGFGVEYSF